MPMRGSQRLFLLAGEIKICERQGLGEGKLKQRKQGHNAGRSKVPQKLVGVGKLEDGGSHRQM